MASLGGASFPEAGEVMMLLKFPKKAKPQKAARPAGGPAARVHAFPAARHVRIVSFIAKEMRVAAKRATGDPDDEAELTLISHLEVLCALLEALGVSEVELEREARSFAVTAWAAYGRERDDRSGAA